MPRIKLFQSLAALTIRQRLLIAFVPNLLLIIFISLIAGRKQVEAAEFAAIKEAQAVAETIEYFITDTTLAGSGIQNLTAKSTEFQSYVMALHEQQQRDIEIVDLNHVIIADVVAEDIGTVFTDDQNGEVKQTIADGIPRTFTEISEDYPDGVELIVIPLDLDSGEVVGAMILEYTPLRNEILAFTTSTRQLVGFFGLISIVIVIGIGIFVPDRINAMINEMSSAVVAVAEGRWGTGSDIQLNAEMGGMKIPFNRMSDAIQERDAKLKEAARLLELRVQETQEALERAERADQVKSAFLASMSHELRTPLNAVINYSKFVVKGTMGPVTERQVSALNKVVDSGKHLLSLINDVLDMSRIESGSLNLYVEENIALPEILNNAIATAEGLIQDKEKDVELILNMEDDLPTLTGDRQRIYQIMLNILSNACKFTESGSIIVTAWHEQTEVHISVQDTGPGIAKEDTESVFTAFKQTGTGLRQGSGTGLGMPISKSLIEAHGGRLWFESTVGKGTTFHVTLPVESTSLIPVVMA